MAASAATPWPKSWLRILPLLRTSQRLNNKSSPTLLLRSNGAQCTREVSSISTTDNRDIKINTAKSKGNTNKAVMIGRAMKIYLDRVKEHDDMMKAEYADYVTGKRHLANIMGENPDTFTQDDVDKAISYLLPSGIFEKKARPMLKDPYTIFPKRKDAQFGLDGRPHDSMYYTLKPNYYNILYDINWKLEDIKVAEDKYHRSQPGKYRTSVETDNMEFKTTRFAMSEWISIDKLRDTTLEKINEKEYNHLLVLMERLAASRLSHTEEEFIMKFRKPLDLLTMKQHIPEIEIDENGRSYAKGQGRRKQVNAWVKVYKPGTGQVLINGEGLDFFKHNIWRENLLGPLTLTGLLGQVDVCAEVEINPVKKLVFNNFHAPPPQNFVKGPAAYCGAIRLGLSRALTAFVDNKTRENLRLAGMLSQDPRVKERKKPGQWKARKKFTWKKR